MNERKDGGPAFPQGAMSADQYSYLGQAGGMSLRDYFAAAAISGLISGAVVNDGDLIAQDAYIIADAMLKRRSL